MQNKVVQKCTTLFLDRFMQNYREAIEKLMKNGFIKVMLKDYLK
jgi:hypothetical protein